ncbi:MAG: glycerophosphodiester phosphodiesterase [Clostridiales bacterium]|nr:glycerophosphodiester phosphodiesterase [Clostridiales bacterium]
MDPRALTFVRATIGAAAAGTLICGVGWSIAADLISTPQEAPTWLRETPIAHRGLHTGDAVRPENSLAAFRAAADGGYPIELDVHLAADGVPVVFHDDALERMTGDPRLVSEVTSAELKNLALLNSSERIPALDEVLALVENRVPILIEIKQRGEPGALERAVVNVVRAHPAEVAVQSFNPYSLAYVKTIAPDLPRGQLSGSLAGEKLPGWQTFALRHTLMNWASKPAFIAYELDALPSWGTSLQRARGRPLLGWTANNPEDFERAQHVCDGVIFSHGAF